MRKGGCTYSNSLFQCRGYSTPVKKYVHDLIPVVCQWVPRPVANELRVQIPRGMREGGLCNGYSTQVMRYVHDSIPVICLWVPHPVANE